MIAARDKGPLFGGGAASVIPQWNHSESPLSFGAFLPLRSYAVMAGAQSRAFALLVMFIFLTCSSDDNDILYS